MSGSRLEKTLTELFDAFEELYGTKVVVDVTFDVYVDDGGRDKLSSSTIEDFLGKDGNK